MNYNINPGLNTRVNSYMNTNINPSPNLNSTPNNNDPSSLNPIYLWNPFVAGKQSQASNEIWEMVLGVFVLTAIIGLFITSKNFKKFQLKNNNESPIIQNRPNFKAIFFICVIIAFLLLILPSIVFKK